MKKNLWFPAVLLSMFCMAGSGIAGDTVKVGFVDTYSGPATTFTNDVLDGFEMAAEKINAKDRFVKERANQTCCCRGLHTVYNVCVVRLDSVGASQ